MSKLSDRCEERKNEAQALADKFNALNDQSKKLEAEKAKVLAICTPSFLITVASRTCTTLYKPTISILSYSIDSANAIRINLRLKQV